MLPASPCRQVTNFSPPSDELPPIEAAVAGTSGNHHDKDHKHARVRQVELFAVRVSDSRGGERSTSYSRVCRQAQWEIRRDLHTHSSRPLDSEAGGTVAEKKESVEPTVRKLCRMANAGRSAEE